MPLKANAIRYSVNQTMILAKLITDWTNIQKYITLHQSRISPLPRKKNHSRSRMLYRDKSHHQLFEKRKKMISPLLWLLCLKLEDQTTQFPLYGKCFTAKKLRRNIPNIGNSLYFFITIEAIKNKQSENFLTDTFFTYNKLKIWVRHHFFKLNYS